MKSSIPHKCPVCDGTGFVSRPPYLPGDVDTWASHGIYCYTCKLCDGGGIVWGGTQNENLEGFEKTVT